VTYCWDNVDIAVSIQRHGVDEKDRESCEVVVSEPFRAGDGEFIWDAVLFRR
jgi:hypothetical protein